MAAITRFALVVVALGLFLGVRPVHPAAAATTTVQIGDFWFCNSSFQNGNCVTNIAVGDSVKWQSTSGFTLHTTTECDGVCAMLPPPPSPMWDSGSISPGGSFTRMFTQAGTYNYRCNVHPTEMRGTIVVTAPVGGIAQLPGVGDAAVAQQRASGGSPLPWAAAAGVAAITVLLGGTLWFARRRLSR